MEPIPQTSQIPPTQALLAMTATAGSDIGTRTGLRVVAAIGGFGGAAALLSGGTARGGWFTAATLFFGVAIGIAYLAYRRYELGQLAGRIGDRYGNQLFLNAVPLMNDADRIIDET